MEAFFVGASIKGQEIALRGYTRQRLMLTPRPLFGDFGNAEAVAFAPALLPWGFVDGMVLAGSATGPVIAKVPLIVPSMVGVGNALAFDAFTIVMNARSMAALKHQPACAVS